jgi:hypothetical protein
MIETHDFFLRALAVPVKEENQKKDKKRNTKNPGAQEDERLIDEPKWPEYILALDTETRITVDQSLTFGVWRLCKLVGLNYLVIEEGIFYADNLPAKHLGVLKKYMETAVSDVPAFPPRFPLYSLSEFMKKVFWTALKKFGSMVVGFNLGYDLARLAKDWKEGDKGE